ncbi:XCR1 protein, partial [Rhadina sibilatrix]|nr:XCR1 protein [Rhadina sibilatrix]
MDEEYYLDDNSSYEYPHETNVCEMGDYFTFNIYLTAVLYILVFLLSLLGNTLVLWILLKYENLTSLTNIFIMNLCISDLVFSCMLPFWVVDQSFGWIFGEFLCKASNAVFSAGYYSGVFFLTLMTILRYLFVVNPLSTLRSQTQCCGVLVSLAVWTVSILIVVPEVIHTTVQEDLEEHRFCDADGNWKKVDIYVRNALFLLSFGVIVFCYFKILLILLRPRSRRKHKTVKLILIIVVAFFLCWAPYNILSFLTTFPPPACQYAKDTNLAFHISRKIAFSHCCLNPVLYVFVGVKFKRHLAQLCRLCLHSNNDPVSSPRTCHEGKFQHEGPSIY